MPVSVKSDPFGNKPTSRPADKTKRRVVKQPVAKRVRVVEGLSETHLRVLKAMKPESESAIEADWPVFTRAVLRKECGMSPTNSMNRILHGVKDGPSKHLGLLGLGLIEELVLDIVGVSERNYKITRKGIECLSQSEDDPK